MVSFGLANDEVIGPPEPFAEAYAIARDAGLLSTPHAGELCGPESVSARSTRSGPTASSTGCGPSRIPSWSQRLADEGICLDVCPTSNLLLGVVAGSTDHPLPALLDAGVRCSVNADDPLLFGPGLLEEYELCRAELGLDDAALATIATASIEASGAPPDLKARALAGIANWLT